MDIEKRQDLSKALEAQLEVLRNMSKKEFLELYRKERKAYFAEIERVGGVKNVDEETWASWGNIAAAAAYRGIKPEQA